MELIDIHSHILPGIDDGPSTMEESLRMCERYVLEGVTTVVATPHTCDRRFEVTGEKIRRGVEALTLACERRGLELTVLSGSEVKVEPELARALDEGEALTLGETGRYALIELPAGIAPRLAVLEFELWVRGITPILGHPERNFALWRRPGRLAELVERGWLVQVTGLSLLGGFGAGPRLAAEWFVKMGLAHVVASDAHSAEARQPELRRAFEAVTALAGEKTARRLLATNPGKIVRGEEVEERAREDAEGEASLAGISEDGLQMEMERL